MDTWWALIGYNGGVDGIVSLPLDFVRRSRGHITVVNFVGLKKATRLAQSTPCSDHGQLLNKS